jgi:hypothetical protein
MLVYINFFNNTKDSDIKNQDSSTSDDEPDNDADDEDDSERFELNSEYIDENRWEYEVKGYMPTPCHSIIHQAIVAESFPEQVTIEVTITAPQDEIICSQAIEETVLLGSYSASEQSTYKLKVIWK